MGLFLSFLLTERDTGFAGFAAESNLVNHLKKHGLMDKKTPMAGNSGNSDFHIKAKSGSQFEGNERHVQGESKIGLGAEFGRMNISHTPERGFHISDKARQKYPNLSKHIEKATVNGRPLLDHMNRSIKSRKFNPKKKMPGFNTDEVKHLRPVHGYMADHGTDVLHVHSHGTFRGGLSEKSDRTGVGFPRPEGAGKFRVQHKIENGVNKGISVSFKVHKMNHSHIDLMNHEHVQHVKTKLGY